MSLCSACGVSIEGAEGLCLYHRHDYDGDGWAHWNKVFCDWIHRGVEPPPAPPKAPEETETWAY